MVVIVDYGMGNVSSVANMVRRAGGKAHVTGDPGAVAEADRLILPGVGAFSKGMAQLTERDLVSALHVAVVDREVPILGICLGLQLMTRGSEEGEGEGLGWVAADTKRFDFGLRGVQDQRIPHMGWGQTHPPRPSTLFAKDGPPQRFYYVHSYHAVCDDPAVVTAECDYGYRFTAGFESGNVMGVQFHPEKSHRFGLNLLTSFLSGGVAPSSD